MKSLKSLKGIDKSLIEKLGKNEVESVEDLLAKADTPEKRRTLGSILGIDQREFSFLVEIAELTKIPDLTELQAAILISVGIRCIQEFIDLDPEALIKSIHSKYPDLLLLPSVEDVRIWQKKARAIGNIVIPDAGGSAQSSAVSSPETTKPAGAGEIQEEFYTGMCDLMAELGKGVASAQRELDFNSMETQQTINDTPALREYGLMAQWYTIPETAFSLKMDYAVVTEKQESGQGRTKFLLSPINARYQNYFKVSQASQSQLNFKIVPIPPPSRVTEAVYTPDLLGKSISETKTLLAKVGLNLGRVEITGPTPSSDEESIVESQVPPAGEEARFNDKVYVRVKKKAG